MKTFRFTEVDTNDMENEILKLNNNKTYQVSDIPIKVIKDNVDTFADFLYENTNSIFKSSLFPFCSKLAGARALHKKDIKKNLKVNDRPVIILSILPKMLRELCLPKY